MTNFNQTNAKWLNEILLAIRDLYSNGVPQDLQRVNAIRKVTTVAARNRKIKDPAVISAMKAAVDHGLAQDLRFGGDIEGHFEIMIALAYMNAHVAAGLIKERAAERVLDYVTARL